MPDQVPYIGRTSELKKLNSVLESALQRKGKTVFVGGEAGVGKTAMVEKVLKEHEGEYALAKGWCLPDSNAPLLPFTEALGCISLEDTLQWSAPPRLESIFLVTKDGIPVASYERTETGLDADIFASMLSAVSSFVDDSMTLHDSQKQSGALSGLEYGEYKVVIESQQALSLVGLIKGRDDEVMRSDMRILLDGFQEEYAPKLEDWDGDLEMFESAEVLIKDLTDSGRYDGVDHIQADPEMKRGKVFEAVIEGLKRRSVQGPIVLFIDDLQWADESSMSLVHHISRSIKNHGICVICTYRPEESEESSQLIKALRLMSREGVVDEIDLERLKVE